MSDWTVPTFADVLAARRRIAAHLLVTPLFRYPALDDLIGTQVHVKHENHQPVGAFKVRGGVNLVAQLSDHERERGLIGASTGNHGQSLAFAARRFGVTARICVPERANPVKLATPFALPQQILREHLDDFVLVSEEQIRAAQRTMIEATRNLVEASGAAPLAAALEAREQLEGRRVALVASGGNVSPAQLLEVLA